MANIPEIAKQIKILILDVDGVLTNGSLSYDSKGIVMKEFHVHDGVGIKLLKKAGIETAIITAKQSDIITKRMSDLEIPYVYQNQNDKVSAYDDIKQKCGYQDHEIAYVGDDLPDIPVIRRAGLGIAVANAHDEVKKYAIWTTTRKGGEGAVREISDFILNSQNKYNQLIDEYVTR